MSIKQYNYETIAEVYDLVELGGGEGPITSEFLDNILRKYKVKSVLDMTCGTGSQTIGLTKRGYKVTGSDINRKMLNIAIKKSKNLSINYHEGDIRTSKFGKFDAVIAMFNAIGHLSKKDFEKSIKNVRKNLKEKGLFVFDIFNRDYIEKNFLTHEFIDTANEKENIKFVRFNKNKLDLKNGVMRINQKTYLQEGMKKPNIISESWDMKIYTYKELKKILENNNFKINEAYDYNGNKFNEKTSNSVIIVAQSR